MPYPARIRGSKIALLSTSSALPDEQLLAAQAEVEAAGMIPVTMPHASDAYGYLAGRDEDRAADLMQAFLDDEIGAIWAVRGGYGAARLLPYLDFDAIHRNAKPLVGYSDHTALQLALLARARVSSFHGVFRKPNAESPASRLFDELFFKEQASIQLDLEEASRETAVGPPEIIHPGSAKGMLIGGNLTVFQSMLGTPYMPELKGAILFLEDVHEVPYRVDRMLNQLKQLGILKGAQAILLGQFTHDREDLGERLAPGPFEMEEILRDAVHDLMIPVIANLPFGHIKDQLTLVQGSTVSISTDPLEMLLELP